MRATITKWVSILALLLAVPFWDSAASYQLRLNMLVSIAVAVVMVLAVQANKYHWAAGFVAMALLLNPVAPPFRIAAGLSLLLVALSMVSFAGSLATLKPQPLLSIPSITDRDPGCQSP